jgi:hypothetical protein
MTQPDALPDLREVRTRFLPKMTAYALSYGYALKGKALYEVGKTTALLRLASPTSDASECKVAFPAHRLPSAGHVFNVLRNARVPGLDGGGYQTPVDFRVCSASESVTWREADRRTAAAEVMGDLEGRMTFEAGDSPKKSKDRPPIRISVTYEGTIQLPSGTTWLDLSQPKTLEGNAFITTFFEITLADFRWLTQNGSIAFGTWRLKNTPKVEDIEVEASFDVYQVL